MASSGSGTWPRGRLIATLAVTPVPPTLGPNGYGSIKLGMTAGKAKATGAIVKKRSKTEGPCSTWDLKKFPTPKGSAGVYVSPTKGVSVIFAPKGVKTPQGIKIGSTLKQLKAAYPRVQKAADDVYRIKVPSNKKAQYVFVLEKGKVADLYLALTKQNCFD
jgi:hypothetical protein